MLFMLKEPNQVTFDDAQKHLSAVAQIRGIIIYDPMAFFHQEIIEVGEKLERMRHGEEKLPDGMTQEEAVSWLEDVLKYQQAYLACYEKPKVRLGRPENINAALERYEAERKPDYPETSLLQAALEKLQQVEDVEFQGYKNRLNKEFLESGSNPPMPHLCHVFCRVSEAIENPTSTASEFPTLNERELEMLQLTAAYFILILI